MATVSELGVKISGDSTGLQQALDETKRMLEQLKNSVANAGKDVGGLGQAIGKLGEPVTATSKVFRELTNAISQVSPEAARMTQSVISGVEAIGGATTLAAAGIVGVGLAIGKVAFDAAVEFDKASDRIRVATGATGAALTGLEQSFKNVFTSIPTSAASASEAIAFLNGRLQITGPELENLAKSELELSRITGSALRPQLEATTRVFKDWEIATGSQSTALDTLFKVSQRAQITVTELAQALVQFGAPLRSLGFSFDEAAVLLGKFRAEGVEMSKVLPGLRILLKNLAEEGVTDAKGALQLLIEKIRDTKTSMEGIGLAIEAFGSRAGTDFAEAIKQGRFNFEDWLKVIEGSGETIQGAGKDVNDYGESWTQMWNKAQVALLPLGNLIFNTLSAIAGTFNDEGDKVNAKWNAVLNGLVNDLKILDGTDVWFLNWLISISSLFDKEGNKAGQLWASGVITESQKLGPMYKGTADFLAGMQGMFAEQGKAAGDAYARQVRNSVLGVMDPLAQSLKKLQQAAAFQEGQLGGSPKGAGIGTIAIRDDVIESWKKLAAGVQQYSFKVTEATSRTKEHTGATDDASGGHGRLSKAIGSTNVALTEQSKLAKEVNDGMAAIVESIDKVFRTAQANQIIYDKGRAVIEKLKQESAELGSTITAQTIPPMQKMGEVALFGDGSFEALLNRLIDSKRAAVIAAESAKQVDIEFKKLSDHFQDLSSSLPRAWNTIIDGILTGTGKVGSNLLEFGVKVKGYAKDVLNVFETMPGKWGDAFRKTLSEVDKWINFLDSAIKLIQRLFGDKDPSGLGGILSGIGGIFKKTTADIQDASMDWSTALENMSKGTTTQMGNMASGVSAGASKIVAGFGQIAAAALAFTGAAGGPGGWKGALTGAFSGALGGLAAAGGIAQLLSLSLTPLTFGLSALGGAIVGGLLGLFGGGKSAAQKEQERLQLEQTKISVQQSAQSVINAAIQGFEAAMVFFDHLEEFTAPRKRKFAQFWEAMTRLMNGFLELAKAWSTTSLAQAKALSETVKPIAEAISALPEAFTAISGHFGVTQAALDRFFADFDKVMTAFFARADVWVEGVSKRAQKVANRLAPAVALIADFGTALTNISGIKEPPDEVFEIFDRVIDKILVHVTELNLRFEKDVLKSMANFSEKAGFALVLWKTAIESITGMVDIKMPTDADFANVFAAIERVIAGMTAMAERLSTDSLGKAEAIANASLAIFASIKAGVEALTSLRDFTGVLPETFQTFLNDFEAALTMLEAMSTRAMQFENIAKIFEDYIASGAASLSHAFTMLQQIMNAAGALFPGGAPGEPVGGEAGASSVPGMATGGTVLSTGLAYLHTGERVIPAAKVDRGGDSGSTSVTVNFYGTVLDEAKAETFVYNAVRKAQRRGRLILSPAV